MIFKTKNAPEFYLDEGCFIREIINVAEIPNISISQARVEVGQTTELHSLTGVEIYYILMGEGLVELGSAEKRTVERSDVVYISAGQPQRIQNTGKQDLVFLCICLPRFRPQDYAPRWLHLSKFCLSSPPGGQPADLTEYLQN